MQKPELVRIFKDLQGTKVPWEQKEKSAIELQSIYYKYINTSDEIFARLQKMINSQDLQEKYGGILALDHLTSAVQESQMLTFVNKFLSNVFAQFGNTDEKFLRKNAEVFGKLLRLGGSKIAQLVDQHFSEAQRWLRQDNRRLAGLLVLKEMLIEAPSITFTKLFNTNAIESLNPIIQAIRMKSLSHREAALDLFGECVKQVAQRELSFQQDILHRIYKTEIDNQKASRDVEVIHGNLMMINILFTYAKAEIFSQQVQDICKYVISKKDSSSPLIIKAVIETLPTLAKHVSQSYLQEFIDTSIQFLLQQTKQPKTKGLAYNTIGDLVQFLNENIMAEKVKAVVKHIKEELTQRSKPFCVEIIQCLNQIYQIYQKHFSQFTKVDVLIDQILLNGLHYQSVAFLNLLCKTQSDQSEYIQYKLLQTIAAILLRKIITFVNNSQHRHRFNAGVLEAFQDCLQKALQQQPEFNSPEAIANAIQTLCTFQFDNQQDSLAIFVKDAVLPNLANPNAVIRKATAKAGCLLYVKKSRSVGPQMISKNVMYEILDKFMNVAISDTEQDIRQTMLSSLNENFDPYLNSPNNLRKLFLCMNDPIPEVQEIALTILCRLSILNPSEIIPFLKNTLFEYLQTLTFDQNQPEKQTIIKLQLLTCLIRYGKSIVQPYTSNIAHVLYIHLKNPNTSAMVTTYLFQAFAQLTESANQEILVHLNEVFQIIISAMQDKSSTLKREAAVKSLNLIIKNTGFVVLPYYRYPNLMDVIFQLIRTEIIQELRHGCLKLLGNLGAIDSFIYKSYVNKGLPTKQRFQFIQNYQNAVNQATYSELLTEVRGYYEDLILLGNFRTNLILHLGSLKQNFNQSSLMFDEKVTQVKMPLQNKDPLAHYHQAIQQDDIEQLFLQVPVIQLNNLVYYSQVTLKTLLQILLDPSLQSNHELALETIMWIIGTLKSKTYSYLNYLIPVFARLLQRNEDMREKVLNALQKVIHLCGIQFSPDYIDQVMACVMLFCNGQESVKLAMIGLEIMDTLIKCSKNHLRHKVEPIVRLINSEISQFEEEKDLVKKGIQIYRSLENLLDSQLHMVVPFMCKLLSKEVQQFFLEVRKDIIHLFVSLSRTCPSTVQYLSLIMNSLLNLLELSAKTQHQLETHQTVLNCIVNLIFYYKNLVLVYMPMIHQQVQRHKIHHQQYQKIVELFLMYGNLEDLNSLLEDDSKAIESLFPIQQQQYYTTEPNAPMYKKNEPEELVSKFDTQQIKLKDEWNEWLRNTSVELLKQSPYLVLSPCSSIAEVYPTLAYELYNIAFDSVWHSLNDKYKEQMIQFLKKAIQADNVPLPILQTILNLAEFMQHDKEGLQIDIATLGELAERCNTYAKALYYREHQFETASHKTIESLTSLYTNLGLQESANGLLTYAKTTLKLNLKNTDYERLQKWDEALDYYRSQQIQVSEAEQEQFFAPKMRCFNALMDWNSLIIEADRLFGDKSDDIHKQSTLKHKQMEIAHLAANAAMHLGQWEKLELYTTQVSNDNDEKPFWTAAVHIAKNNLEEAKKFVLKARDRLDGIVTGLLQESYDRAQDGVLKLQQLVEMEEIIELKQFEYKVKNTENVGEYQYLKLNEELEQKRKQLRDIWQDRLSGAPKDINVWYRLLSTRQLYQPKIKDLEIWIKFARLCLKRQKMVLCGATVEMLKQQFYAHEKAAPLPVSLYIFDLQCEYLQKKLDILEQVRNYFKDKDKDKGQIPIDAKLKAKTFFTLGKWAYERAESANELELINRQFDESLQYNPSYAKAWHYFALCNFEAIELFAQDHESSMQNLSKHVFAAVKGFIKSISLGSRDPKKGRYILQDTLRLLSLLFKYGMQEDIAQEFKENYKSIDVIAWIDVIPQILARIQIQNQTIQNLLQILLIHISRSHAQALIYPLTVACKSKNQIKRVQVLNVLDDMKNHSPVLVNEALIISEELNRTAILLKESWKEGIQEAWSSYFQDKNKAHVERILRGLHDNMRAKPESLSEISFHQTYGQEIFEAEAWFQRYLRTEDQVCLCVAFDIYSRVYHRVQKSLDKMKKVHLENVSPKLLATQNCEISVPGLYKPNGPLVTINGFAPRLDVLSSKQHPRQVKIYGSDSKEYHFLLKGHEDLRQDERVMQLFSLVNRLLTNDSETERKDLTITRYSVIPLSHNTGLLGWVQNCDTLQQLIREYRENSSIQPNAENKLMESFCMQYQNLPLANKIEIYRHILENTRGEDIQKVLWIKSPNSETWLERRINYTRSLATMSMVGYILGLGDRHPSNIMLQRYTGKIVHIDFGDCFEVAMRRERYPERVPFRLTRMLVKAMEACGIEGIYRHTCNTVMRVLRDNKESLLAVLDSFVYDPLLTWRLLNTADHKPKKEQQNIELNRNLPQQMINKLQEQTNKEKGNTLIQNIIPGSKRRSSIIQEELKEGKAQTPKRKESGREKELYLEFADEEREIPDDLQNQKGLEVIERIKKKLLGRDFRENEVLKTEDQVNQLILQATNHENIAQAYLGWCPFW